MSVAAEFILPEQPASGDAIIVPLGGNGFSAPRLVYVVNKFAVTGDASGGSMTLEIEMDPRFVSLVSYLCGQVQQGTSTDREHRMTVSCDTMAEQVDQGDVTSIASTIASFEWGHTWEPRPALLPGGITGGSSETPRATWKMLNIDGDVYNLSALIYCFDIRAREVYGTGQLLWGRGSN